MRQGHLGIGEQAVEAIHPDLVPRFCGVGLVVFTGRGHGGHGQTGLVRSNTHDPSSMPFPGTVEILEFLGIRGSQDEPSLLLAKEQAACFVSGQGSQGEIRVGQGQIEGLEVA
ncbi:MAG: hypothetical protein QXD60_01140 [Nanopusillaceae archaeon]